MFIRYYELKKVIYIALAILGVALTTIAIFEFAKIGAANINPTSWLTGMVCMLSGAGMIFFSIETFLLRDDPDVWR